MVLRTCYEKGGTEPGYGATRGRGYSAINPPPKLSNLNAEIRRPTRYPRVLSTCYKMSGTDVAYRS
eukprot:3175521-Rhodomonas_salina.3